MDSRRRLLERGRAVAAELAWRQWTALGPIVASPRGARSIVDPEALLLPSLQRMDAESRMARLIPWWATAGVRLLSVQRVSVRLPT